MADGGHYARTRSDESSTQTSQLYAHMGTWQTSSNANTQPQSTLESHSHSAYNYPRQIHFPPAVGEVHPTQYNAKNEQHYYNAPRPWAYGNPVVYAALNNATHHSTDITQTPHNNNYYYNNHESYASYTPQTHSNHNANNPLTASSLQDHQRQTTPANGVRTWACAHPRDGPWNATGEVGKGSEYERFNTKL